MARQGKARVLTQAEFKRAEAMALQTTHAKRNQAILYASFGLALRACEIRRLKIADVLAPDWTLYEEISLRKEVTKGKKQRHIYLTNDTIRKVFLDYLTERKANEEKRKRAFSFNQPLFLSNKQGEFSACTIVSLICGIYKSAGLIGAKSHSGRRTRITRWLDEGVDIKAIADIVGHSSIQTTADYHESSPTRLKSISKRAIF